MLLRRYLIAIVCLPLLALCVAKAQERARLQALIEAAPRLRLVAAERSIHLPAGQEMGRVSWLAREGKTGVTWLIQRGDKTDPVMAVDASGRVLRSFGKGLYTIPHAIRIDPEGNVWTVDAGSSKVIKFTPQGEKLLQIEVGGVPASCKGFCGATDIAFAGNGRIFISDGYANARVIEYTAEGRRVREWGSAGRGRGQFQLPHSIVAGEGGVLYVADRENGRIERFNLEGKYLGEIANLGRTYSLQLGTRGTLWAGMAPLDEPTGAPGWLVHLDGRSGAILGYVPVAEMGGLHTVEVDGEGNPMTAIGNRVIVFKHR